MNKKNIIQLIKNKVEPVLFTNGFLGKFPYYSRDLEEKIELVGFQFGTKSLQGKIVFNMRKKGDWVVPESIKNIPLEDFTYEYLPNGKRLGFTEIEGGIWFDYENSNLEEITKKINELLDKEIPLFFDNK